ncbi:MAG TPA: copper-translocating P-type ATPase [Bacteroidetes bacterium]|nr:copper-translocating P-type ATPase [Bacteroidota bacterium]
MKNSSNDPVGHTRYYCPMKCEGEKTYEEPGRCPVCHMYLVPEGSDEGHGHKHSRHMHGRRHSEKKENVPEKGKPGGYICPMRCEGNKAYEKPGDCPVCGMALVPEKGEETREEDAAYRRLLKKFWWAVALSLPVLVIAMSDMIGLSAPGEIASKKFLGWVQFLLATPVVFYSSRSFFIRGYQSVRRWSPNMWTLISVGVGAAYLFSVLGLLVPGLFPAQFRDENGNVHLYFEAAAVILTLVLMGQVLELRAHRKTSSAIRELIDLVPPVARIIRHGHEQEIPLEEVQAGDILRVKPGEKIPVDGVITRGTAVIDESMITGESIPVDRSENDPVTGGTINGNTSFEMRAEKVGSYTLLSQIIHMVHEASHSRAPIQKLADTVARYFVQIVISVAALTFAAWALWGPEPAYVYAFVNAVAVLIIACPCALGLATPISVMVGSGRMAQSGILVRDAAAIEAMNQVDTLIIDKTGTLTEGKPGLKAYRSFGAWTDEEVFRVAVSVEAHSEHPVARAMVKGAANKGMHPEPVEKFESVPGKGVRAQWKGATVGLGNYRLMEDFGAGLTPEQEEQVKEWQSKGQTVMFLLTDGRAEGIIGVADTLKTTSAGAIQALQEHGIRVYMLTGDNEYTARAVAGELNLDGYEANCLPGDKFRKVQEMQAEGRTVAMAGDGINDAPALEQAHVGIAMGTGADIAMKSAGITLVKGNLEGIVRARELSHRVMRNIRQNLFFAFVYNSVGVPVAAGVLYPFFGILLSPVIAAAAMSFSSVSVITNALRLRKK